MSGFILSFLLFVTMLISGFVAIIFGLLNYPLFSLLFILISCIKGFLFVEISKTLY